MQYRFVLNNSLKRGDLLGLKRKQRASALNNGEITQRKNKISLM